MLNKTVEVLLSSYNGEKYIAEQLDSILNQTYQNIEIMIRDDGSTDQTVKILDDYSKKYNNIFYYVGKNIGASNSFLDLMRQANFNNAYFAFADQDDYWLENKIEQAVKQLSQYSSSIPLLYACNITLVNDKLEVLSQKKSIKYPSFGNSLLENICAGCTCVFNRSLMKIYNEHTPQCIYMHDWWMYQLSSAYGKVIYDSCSYILYRQHENNVIGSEYTLLDIWKKRILNYKKNKIEKQKQLLEVKKTFTLSKENQNLLSMLINSKNFKRKISIMKNPYLVRQKKLETMIYKLFY